MQFSGTWYPDQRDDIAAYLPAASRKRAVIGMLCPHAGWVYSGKLGGKVFAAAKPADTYVIIGPNHQGAGAAVSVYPSGAWETPLGNLAVHEELAAGIIAQAHGAGAVADTRAHEGEHSIEVLLPFIALSNPAARIVPIALADYRPATCKALGLGIAAALKSAVARENVIIVASSDMTHFESEDNARNADQPALEAVMALNPDKLLSVVAENDISMCGSGPGAVMLWAAKQRGASAAELIGYTSSAAVTGDQSNVVAYAGAIVF
jgi:AmmeMemoRadiSam system protein B